jgi:hypothetical protein
MIECTTCLQEIHPLAVFPNGICLECYEIVMENAPMPTAQEIRQMWGGK